MGALLVGRIVLNAIMMAHLLAGFCFGEDERCIRMNTPV